MNQPDGEHQALDHPAESASPHGGKPGTRTPPIVLFFSLGDIRLFRGDAPSFFEDIWRVLCTYPLAQRINALDLLAALRDPTFHPLFAMALVDESWEVRAAAAQALGNLRLTHLLPLLLTALSRETDWLVQQALVRAIGKIHNLSTIPLFSRLLLGQQGNVLVREAAAWALGEYGAQAPRLLLEQAQRDDPEEIVRQQAASILERLQQQTE